MLAAQEGHSLLVERLLKQHGAPIDQHAHDGKTALRYCVNTIIRFIIFKLMQFLINREKVTNILQTVHTVKQKLSFVHLIFFWKK